MNANYLREIPLRILKSKIGDEHVTLLQACYDNPIFNEEDGKGIPQQNGTEKSGKPSADYNGVEVCNSRGFGGHVASEYMHSLPPGAQRPHSNDVTFRGHRKRKRRCILFGSCFVIAALVTGLLIFIFKDDQSVTESSSVISLAKIEVNLTLKGGPFSPYQEDYKVFDSDASMLLRRAFIYKIADVLSSSALSHIYNSSEIVRISNSNGSVSLTFILPLNVTCPANCEKSISSILIKGLKDSSFIVDPKSVSVKLYVAVPVKSSSAKPGHCIPMTYRDCINMTSYFMFELPNILGHRTEGQVNSYLKKHDYLLDVPCFGFSPHFYCSAFFPRCTPVGKKPVLPCRQYCKQVMSSCQVVYSKRNISMPFKCDDLPDSNDPNICTKSPFKPGKCVPVTHEECKNIGFSKTTFPNAIGEVGAPKNPLIHVISMLQNATGCFKHSVLFACSIINPPCSGKPPPNHFIPPCKSLCQKYKDRCEIFLNLFHTDWPEVNCSALPDSPDPNICTGYHEAREPDDRVCFRDQVQCRGEEHTCLNKNWFCDGNQDCRDNSDEKHCARCSADEVQCSSMSALCIDKNQGCDGIPNCYEETDELYCVRLDPTSDDDVLQVRNAITSRWEHVCKDGWTQDFSDLTCKQLGYSKTLAAYFTPQNSKYNSIITTLSNGSDPERLQSYLMKGQTKCPSGYVVKLQCWKAACGIRPAHIYPALRVVGGGEVSPGTWPWMVSLHGGSSEAFFCGATIIDDEWVLTAAHCVGGADRETSYWTLKTGNTRRDVYSKYRQKRKPKRLFRHHNFDYHTVENDIALIQLEKPFKLNDYVRAICLPDKPTYPGTRCIVTGWGKSSFLANNYQQALKEVAVDVTSWKYCYKCLKSSTVQVPYTLTETMFCAGGSQNHDGCQGDSGGPLVCRKENTTDQWYQSGVVSWGVICGLRNVPGVYTNITDYMDWINEIIANNTQNMDERLPNKSSSKGKK